jgi:hypothetical protein
MNKAQTAVAGHSHLPKLWRADPWLGGTAKQPMMSLMQIKKKRIAVPKAQSSWYQKRSQVACKAIGALDRFLFRG